MPFEHICVLIVDQARGNRALMDWCTDTTQKFFCYKMMCGINKLDINCVITTLNKFYNHIVHGKVLFHNSAIY